MSSDTSAPSNLGVPDEEGSINAQVKRGIIQSRQEVKEWNRELLIRLRTGEISPDVALLHYGDRVREYLLTIEPIMAEGRVEGAHDIYEETKIGEITLSPPSEYVEKQGRPKPGSTQDFVVINDLHAKTVSINGLKSVIENETVSGSWRVKLRYLANSRGRTRDESITVSQEAPLSREILRDAVRDADKWLQQIGIGVDVRAEHVDDTDEVPF